MALDPGDCSPQPRPCAMEQLGRCTHRQVFSGVHLPLQDHTGAGTSGWGGGVSYSPQYSTPSAEWRGDEIWPTYSCHRPGRARGQPDDRPEEEACRGQPQRQGERTGLEGWAWHQARRGPCSYGVRALGRRGSWPMMPRAPLRQAAELYRNLSRSQVPGRSPLLSLGCSSKPGWS